MARPNLTNVTSILGITTSGSLTTTLTRLLANDNSSNSVLKLNSIIVANINGNSSSDVSIGYSGNTGAGTTQWISFTITIPPDSTFVSLGKDSPIYIEENMALVGTASSNSMLNYIISYEQLS